MKVIVLLVLFVVIYMMLTDEENVVELPEVCQSVAGNIGCEQLGSSKVQIVTIENGFLRIVYKWDVAIGNEAEIAIKNREMVGTFCALREAGIEAEIYRIEAMINLVDANGNVSEGRGIVATFDHPRLIALNCENQLYIDLAEVSDYVLHPVLMR